MKTYILVGRWAVESLFDQEWNTLERDILMNNNGDIIAWDKETEDVATLLDMLHGWDNFIELDTEDIENIKNNTKIQIV